MTREKAIRLLTTKRAQLSTDYQMAEVYNMAIKALEQEPKTNVLDKLRAELHETAEMHEDGDYYLRDEWIDEYFDKYKAESNDEWDRVTMIDVNGNTHKVTFKKKIEDMGDYPDTIPNQFDNMTGSMNL